MSQQLPNPPSSGGGNGLVNGTVGLAEPTSPGSGAALTTYGNGLAFFPAAASGAGGNSTVSFCRLQGRIFTDIPAGAGGTAGIQDAVANASMYRGGTSTSSGFFFVMFAGFDIGTAGPGDDQVVSGVVNASVNTIAGNPDVTWTNGVFVGADAADANLQLFYGNAGVFTKKDLGVNKTLSDVLWMLSYSEKPNSNKATITVDYWAPLSLTRQRLANVTVAGAQLPAALTYLSAAHQFRSPTGVANRHTTFVAFQYSMPQF